MVKRQRRGVLKWVWDVKEELVEGMHSLDPCGASAGAFSVFWVRPGPGRIDEFRFGFGAGEFGNRTPVGHYMPVVSLATRCYSRHTWWTGRVNMVP